MSDTSEYPSRFQKVRTLEWYGPGGGLEKRADKRYPLELNVHYRLIVNNRLLDEGSGRTLNFCRKGVLFLPDQKFPDDASAAELHAELYVAWPRRPKAPPVELTIVGEVLRNELSGVAVKISRYGFWHPGKQEATKANLQPFAAGESLGLAEPPVEPDPAEI